MSFLKLQGVNPDYLAMIDGEAWPSPEDPLYSAPDLCYLTARYTYACCRWFASGSMEYGIPVDISVVANRKLFPMSFPMSLRLFTMVWAAYGYCQLQPGTTPKDDWKVIMTNVDVPLTWWDPSGHLKVCSWFVIRFCCFDLRKTALITLAFFDRMTLFEQPFL